FAETMTTRKPSDTACGLDVAGAADSAAWAFVPAKAKELTPMTALSGRGSSIRLATGVRFNAAKSMFGFAGVLPRDAGISPWRRMRIALINPAIPEAGSRWPTFDLIDPIGRGLPGGRAAPSAAPIACHSMGSPADVPVPWASKYASASGSIFAAE